MRTDQLEHFEEVAQKIRFLTRNLPCGPFMQIQTHDTEEGPPKWEVKSTSIHRKVLSTEHAPVARFLTEMPELIQKFLDISYQIVFNSEDLDNK